MKVWNVELASQALLNVKQCGMNSDACISTELFHFAGQNLARSQRTNGPPIELLATVAPQFI